jgi:hypothetical protein
MCEASPGEELAAADEEEEEVDVDDDDDDDESSFGSLGPSSGYANPSLGLPVYLPSLPATGSSTNTGLALPSTMYPSSLTIGLPHIRAPPHLSSRACTTPTPSH